MRRFLTNVVANEKASKNSSRPHQQVSR